MLNNRRQVQTPTKTRKQARRERMESMKAAICALASENSQKLEKAYFPTGAVWALDTTALRQQHRIYCEPLRMVMMDYDRAVDIDDETDWVVAEALARHNGFSLGRAPEQRGANR